MNDWRKILVLAPHADDGELGCGGTIAKFLREGREVYYVALAYPKGPPEQLLIEEMGRALEVLGIPAENFRALGHETRYFPRDRQEILEDLVSLQKEIEPDLVLLPSTFDTHQDHQVVSNEGFRAFKKASILGYEEPWNNMTFPTEVFSVLSEEDVAKKVKALECYESQKVRPFVSPEYVLNLAKVRGIQIINAKYAEAFQVLRVIF